MESARLQCLTIKWQEGCQGFFAHGERSDVRQGLRILTGRDRVRGKTSMRPALSPILYLQGMTSYSEVLKAGVIQLCRPRRAALGNNDVQGSISSERLVPFALGLPGTMGAHGWDLP
jgi:hypothetical protein